MKEETHKTIRAILYCITAGAILFFIAPIIQSLKPEIEYKVSRDTVKTNPIVITNWIPQSSTKPESTIYIPSDNDSLRKLYEKIFTETETTNHYDSTFSDGNYVEHVYIDVRRNKIESFKRTLQVIQTNTEKLKIQRYAIYAGSAITYSDKLNLALALSYQSGNGTLISIDKDLTGPGLVLSAQFPIIRSYKK